MKNINVKSYAKINLCLNVKGRREDGYHELDMVMIPIELHDSILISEIKGAADNCVTIDDFSLGPISYNLATAAIDKLESIYHFKNKFRVSIHKVIPIQAGLGGGSSNAAFTIKAVNKLLKLGASDEELMKITKSLGADVPFFIPCKPMRCKGIGEIVEPITIKNNYYILIVKPSIGCVTREVFLKADSMDLKLADIDKVIEALKNGDDDLLADNICNSLQEPAISLVPEIQNVIDLLKGYGLKIVQMSGSGSSVFALSQDKKLLKKIANSLEDKYIVELTKFIK